MIESHAIDRIDYDSSDNDYDYDNYKSSECGCESAIGYDSDGEIRHVCHLDLFDYDV